MDNLVLNAFESLTRTVNISTGLGHPNDRDKAIDLVNILKSNGFTIDVIELRIWLTQNGWQAKHIDELINLVEMILSGRHPSKNSKGQMWREDILDYWRKKE